MVNWFEVVPSGTDDLVVGWVEIEKGIWSVPVLDAFSEVEVVDVDVEKTLPDKADSVDDLCPAVRAATGPSTIISPSFTGITCKTAGDRVGGTNCSFDTVNVSVFEV